MTASAPASRPACSVVPSSAVQSPQAAPTVLPRSTWLRPRRRPPMAAIGSTSAIGTAIMASGGSAPCGSATDPAEKALRKPGRDFDRAFSFASYSTLSPRRVDGAQYGLARPAVHLQPRRLLVGAERRAGQHARLAIDLVLVEPDAGEPALHRFDIGRAQLRRCRPWRC